MFNISKYTKTYYNIVNRAKSREILSCYSEKHHIIPKSLGGTNNKDNLVILTAKEHFLCHKLLVKMTEGMNKRKMSHALWAMATLNNSNQKRYKIHSSEYERLREQHSLVISLATKGKLNLGKKHPERTSKSFTTEWRKKLSEARKGKSAWNKGITHSDKTKKLQSALAKNRKKKECPHCLRLMDPSNYARYHGNKCKNYL